MKPPREVTVTTDTGTYLLEYGYTLPPYDVAVPLAFYQWDDVREEWSMVDHQYGSLQQCRAFEQAWADVPHPKTTDW